MNISKPTFMKIKSIAHRDMRRWLGVKTPGRQRGTCPDCGQFRSVFREHRSYNHPTVVEFVCMPCNLRRRSAAIEMTDIETLESIPLVYEWKRPGTKPDSKRVAA